MKSHPLGAYFAATLNTESLLRNFTTLEVSEESEITPPSFHYAQNIIGVTQAFTEWGKSLLLGTMEFLKRIC